jgi:hypothetical protein
MINNDLDGILSFSGLGKNHRNQFGVNSNDNRSFNILLIFFIYIIIANIGGELNVSLFPQLLNVTSDFRTREKEHDIHSVSPIHSSNNNGYLYHSSLYDRNGLNFSKNHPGDIDGDFFKMKHIDLPPLPNSKSVRPQSSQNPKSPNKKYEHHLPLLSNSRFSNNPPTSPIVQENNIEEILPKGELVNMSNAHYYIRV